MFRQLLATAATAVCCFGNPAALAAPTTCWVSSTEPARGQRVDPQVCDIDLRYNANGHTVIDLVTVSDGGKISIVLWQDYAGEPTYAEVFFEKSGRTLWQYRVDKDGDINLYHQRTGLEIWFTVPSSQNFRPTTTA